MVKLKTLKEHVYDYIAEQIMTGGLKANQKIDENKICEEFSISRTPVREALIQLVGDGILLNVPRKGYVVKGLDVDEVIQLYEVIGYLDGLAASKAVKNMTDKDYKDMEFAINSMEVAINSGLYEKYHEQQDSFHSIYLDKCGNDILVDGLNKLRRKLLTQNYNSDDEEDIKNILLKTNEEHKEILRLMKSGNISSLKDYILNQHWAKENARFEVIE